MSLPAMLSWLTRKPRPSGAKKRKNYKVSLGIELLERRLAPAIVVPVTNPLDEFDAYTPPTPYSPIGPDGLISLRPPQKTLV